MQRRHILATMFALLFGLGALTVHAGEKKKELAEKIQMYRKIAIAEELGLDEATTSRLFPILDQYAEKMRVLRKEQRKLKKEIASEAAKANPDAKKLEKLLDELSEKELAFQALRVESFQATKGILTAKQRAMLMEFLPELDQKIREMVAEAKKGK